VTPGHERQTAAGPGLEAELAEESGCGSEPATPPPLTLQQAGLGGLALLLLTLALAAGFTRLSASEPLESDNANLALEGEAMARGNVLLRGWVISEDSYLTTEVPMYAAAVATRGLIPDVAHEVPALLYALLVVVAMLLAGRGSLGVRGGLRMLIPLAILVAFLPGPAVRTLLLGPHHVSTTLLLLLGLLAMDRARQAWHGIALAAVLLAVNQVADPLATYVGVLPIVLVSGVRLLRGPRERGPSEFGLVAAAGASVAAAQLLLGLVHLLAGLTLAPVERSFVHFENLPGSAAGAIRGFLVLSGADLFGQPPGLRSAVALVHLVGLLFVVGVLWVVLSEWGRGRERDRVTQILLVTVLLDAAAYLLSAHDIGLGSSRYLVPALACGAVLAGRTGADWLLERRLALPVTLAAWGYGALFLWSVMAVAPPSRTGAAELGAWLQHRRLHYGLGGYWESSIVTLQTGGVVRVRAVGPVAGGMGPYLWDADTSWYDPGRPSNDARFVVRSRRSAQSLSRDLVEKTFGSPSEVQVVGDYEVFVYDRNVLGRLPAS
jgi:hypothetical protein